MTQSFEKIVNDFNDNDYKISYKADSEALQHVLDTYLCADNALPCPAAAAIESVWELTAYIYIGTTRTVAVYVYRTVAQAMTKLHELMSVYEPEFDTEECPKFQFSYADYDIAYDFNLEELTIHGFNPNSRGSDGLIYKFMHTS